MIIKPNGRNNEEVWNEITTQLKREHAFRIKELNTGFDLWSGFGRPLQFAYSSMVQGYRAMYVAVIEGLSVSKLNEEHFSQAMGYLIYGGLLELTLFQNMTRDEQQEEYTCSFLDLIICTDALCRKSNQTEISLPFSDFIYTLLQNEDWSDGLWLKDSSFCNFVLTLLEIERSNCWPKTIERPCGDFERLIKTAPNKTDFQLALFDYCNYRFANTLGWNSVNATQRRNPAKSLESSVFEEVTWLSVVPFELFLLEDVYFKVFNQKLDLNLEHPLLQCGFLSLPTLNQIPRDNWLTKLHLNAEQSFQQSWTKLISSLDWANQS